MGTRRAVRWLAVLVLWAVASSSCASETEPPQPPGSATTPTATATSPVSRADIDAARFEERVDFEEIEALLAQAGLTCPRFEIDEYGSQGRCSMLDARLQSVVAQVLRQLPGLSAPDVSRWLLPKVPSGLGLDLWLHDPVSREEAVGRAADTMHWYRCDEFGGEDRDVGSVVGPNWTAMVSPSLLAGPIANALGGIAIPYIECDRSLCDTEGQPWTQVDLAVGDGEVADNFLEVTSDLPLVCVTSPDDTVSLVHLFRVPDDVDPYPLMGREVTLAELVERLAEGVGTGGWDTFATTHWLFVEPGRYLLVARTLTEEEIADPEPVIVDLGNGPVADTSNWGHVIPLHIFRRSRPSIPSTMTTTTSTTTSTTTTTTTTTTIPTGVSDLAPGLFCRNLEAEGFSYEEAVAYWHLEGRPDQMDADRNGIPCETVYPPADVLSHWGDPLPTTTTMPSVIFRVGRPEYQVSPLPGSDGMYGSGCTPGSDTLPSGIWFGMFASTSATSAEFDLMCLGPDPDTVHWISNSNPKLRTVRIHPDAWAWRIDMHDQSWYPVTYDEWRSGPVSRFCDDGRCPVWLYINDGEVTEIVELWFA